MMIIAIEIFKILSHHAIASIIDSFNFDVLFLVITRQQWKGIISVLKETTLVACDKKGTLYTSILTVIVTV